MKKQKLVVADSNPYRVPVILTHLTAQPLQKEMNTCERNNGISKTIPDQTLSVRQLNDRALRGQPLTGDVLQPIFLGEQEAVNFNMLDECDRAEFVKQQRRLFNEAKKRVEETNAQNVKKAQAARIKQMIEDQVQLRLAQAKGDPQADPRPAQG